MRKKEEREDAGSCWNRAGEDEVLFVLLGRDAAAPAAIRFWCGERVRLGENDADDQQIVKALNVAYGMEQEG